MMLARMSLTLADREPLAVTVDDLRDVIDLWADREARTRGKVTSIVPSFWAWAEGHDHVPFSPAAKLRRPRAPKKTAPLKGQKSRVLPLRGRVVLELEAYMLTPLEHNAPAEALRVGEELLLLLSRFVSPVRHENHRARVESLVLDRSPGDATAERATFLSPDCETG